MSPLPSLRGAKRRDNPGGVRAFAGLLRFARKDGWKYGAVGLSLLVTAPALADSLLPPAQYSYTQLPDPAEEAKAKALMETIRCLVCQGQSIADSDAELAGDMRSLIRQRIAAGEQPEAIRKWLIERYGDWISYAPPVEPLTWPLWGLPLALLIAGAFLARGRFKRRSRA